jgi:hypothetical protein
VTKDEPTWSTELPTVSGWYWYRLHKWEEGEPVKVEIIEDDGDNLYYVTAIWGQVLWGHQTPEWSGPLEPPGREETR